MVKKNNTISLVKAKRTKRSFVPEKFTQPKIVWFKGEGHKEVGIEEPTWPTREEQLAWTAFERQLKIGHAFNWYAYTQNMKQAEKWVEDALTASKHRLELHTQLSKSEIPVPQTIAWLLRMHMLGLVLTWSEKKSIAKAFKKVLGSVNKSKKIQIDDLDVEKVTIQDRINAKLKITFGELDAAFDDFLNSDQKVKSAAMSIFARTTPPGNRMKDIIAYAEKYTKEINFAITGVPPYDDAYAAYGKRTLKAILNWWNEVITAANGYGVIKRKDRKPRKKKPVSQEKVVSRLKYLRAFPELKLTSLPATEILRSSEVWVYNVRTRKIGLFITDQNASSLDVKGTRIININPVLSVQKTLRKPEKQLKEFMALGKPAAKLWFKKIKSTEIKLKEALNKDSILMKAFK